MEPGDALLMLVVVGLAAAAVLRDIAAYERPARERAPRPAKAPREKRRSKPAQAVAPVSAPVAAPVAAPAHSPGDETWLGQIARHTEHDERSAGRRVVSALLLLTLTLLAAAAVGALIYRGLAGLG